MLISRLATPLGRPAGEAMFLQEHPLFRVEQGNKKGRSLAALSRFT
jgi:hypothetical protein